MSELISMEQLNKRLHEDNLVVIDCRYDLNNPQAGKGMYEQNHIEGAVRFDLGEDLSGKKLEHGGRHPLPDLDVFINKLSEAGIDKSTFVVAYDDQNGPFAARLWWMLKYLGHENVSVLNGNYSEWKKEGYPITTEKPNFEKRNFIPAIQSHMLVDMETVKNSIENDDVLLIDSRAAERYRGEVEPLDSKAGHIPSAKNMFWEKNINQNGNWKQREEFETRFSGVQSKQVIVYCGSGVTATVNILALKTMGIDAQLYSGGWSDWSSYEENSIETN